MTILANGDVYVRAGDDTISLHLDSTKLEQLEAHFDMSFDDICSKHLSGLKSDPAVMSVFYGAMTGRDITNKLDAQEAEQEIVRRVGSIPAYIAVFECMMQCTAKTDTIDMPTALANSASIKEEKLLKLGGLLGWTPDKTNQASVPDFVLAFDSLKLTNLIDEYDLAPIERTLHELQLNNPKYLN